jgi:uncharacterized protein Yka (UPF0111/DUF47 family)
MATKTRMLDELGQQALLLPALLNEALGENDRTKYYFTLLQTARQHAEQPETSFSDLHRERLESGVEEDQFDSVVAGSHRTADGVYEIPLADPIHRRIVAGVEHMLAPLRGDGEGAAASVPEFEARLDRLRNELPAPEAATVSGSYVDRVTSGSRASGDSLHLLVMDLHRALNALQRRIAEESIGGAHVYALDPDDRPLVAAFMEGLNRTAPLKFDHPGLGTTATRATGRLVIQNDIGTTDAHLLVVHVDGLAATLTYTDVHPERLEFFRRQLAPFPVAWSLEATRRGAGLEGDGTYQLCTGTCAAANVEELKRYLSWLGSRLVFLIDWNRARKRLRGYVGGKEAVALLDWGAQHEVGHRGFLQLGGERLVNEAIELAKAPIRYGEPLHEVLGRESTVEFLRFVLQSCAQGLRQGRSEALIRSQVRAELSRLLATAQETALGLASEHASLLVETAMAVRDGLQGVRIGDEGFLERSALRASRWEHAADDLVNQSRALAKRWAGTEGLRDLLIAADDIADSLEEAVSLLTALRTYEPGEEILQSLEALAVLVVHGTREYLKLIETGRELGRDSPREAWEDFLKSVDEVMTVEHQADDASRTAKARILAGASDFRQMQVCNEISARLEEATDDLMRVALRQREYVLGEMTRG